VDEEHDARVLLIDQAIGHHASENVSGMAASDSDKPYESNAESLAVSQRLGFKLSASPIEAGLVAGIFFGRLTRRFGFLPSRRISGPSAEFISVNRLTAGGRIRSLLLAPMNNPYLRLCPGTT
jgi:hypothetical protein